MVAPRATIATKDKAAIARVAPFFRARLPARTTASSTILRTDAFSLKNCAEIATTSPNSAQTQLRAVMATTPRRTKRTPRLPRPGAVHQSADTGDLLLRLEAGQQQGEVQFVHEPPVARLALVLERDAVYRRYLPGAPAEIPERDPRQYPGGFSQRRIHSGWRGGAGGHGRQGGRAAIPGQLVDQLWASSVASPPAVDGIVEHDRGWRGNDRSRLSVAEEVTQ